MHVLLTRIKLIVAVYLSWCMYADPDFQAARHWHCPFLPLDTREAPTYGAHSIQEGGAYS